jgi:hypothetical protein
MKRFSILMSAILAVLVSGSAARASDWGSMHYGGYQPWWNIFAHRNKCLSPEEERLQRFWHDYYDALRRYYGMLDRIDWVAYYKNHGYQINSGCGYGGGGCCGGAQRIQFAPVFVSPTMNWAVPNSAVCGPPSQPPMPPMGMYGGMPPMGPGPGPGPGYGAMPMPYAH